MERGRFEFVDDLTSDLMIMTYAETLENLLENAAYGMFSVICQMEKVSGEREISLEVTGDDEENLLYKWLSELLTQSEIEGLFLVEFEVELEKRDKGLKMKARARGEPATPEKGETVVKAVTLYGLKVERAGSEYRATFSLDI
jgi:SHS2 domain-containing protein